MLNLWSEKLFIGDSVKNNLPSEWGKILNADITYALDNSAGTTRKVLVICCENGVVVTPFTLSTTIPTFEEVLASTFTQCSPQNTGTYAGYYQSSIEYSGVWKPAYIVKTGDRFIWYYQGSAGRNIRFTGLSSWGWPSNQEIRPDGYTFTIKSNTLTVAYNGKTVLQMK